MMVLAHQTGSQTGFHRMPGLARCQRDPRMAQAWPSRMQMVLAHQTDSQTGVHGMPGLVRFQREQRMAQAWLIRI